MNRKRIDRSDEENGSFGRSEVALEKIKPGLKYGVEKDRAAGAGHADSEEGHHRLRHKEEKDIPQGSLAERIRKATKGR